MMELYYKIKHRVIPFFLAYIGKGILHLLSASCKYQFNGLEEFKGVARNEKCMIMAWHNRVTMIAPIFMTFASEFKYAPVVSYSRDGEYIAVLANSYRQGKALRVQHDDRHKALKTLVNHMKYGKHIPVVTPDGPRGPKYKIKPGSVAAAKQTGTCVIPVSWKADHFWQLGTWDGMMIPKPFSTITVDFGEPIRLEKSEERPSEEEVRKIEAALMLRD